MIVSVVAITLKSNQKIILDAASGGLREGKAMADLTWSGDINSTGRQLRGHELPLSLDGETSGPEGWPAFVQTSTLVPKAPQPPGPSLPPLGQGVGF